MNDLVDTTEMYLRTIYDLEEEGVVPLRARIAERLEQSGPTVSQTVSRMERDGLLHVAGDRHLELTDKGRALAVAVMRKHRLAERLLVDVIGLPWEEVHAEACRWEHVMSEDVERRLVAVLDNPTTSPFGNPDPRPVRARRRRSSAADEVDLVRLTELPAGSPVAVVVRQLTEHVQGDTELIARLKDAGVVPNARVTVEVNPLGGVTDRDPRPRERRPAARDGARRQGREGLAPRYPPVGRTPDAAVAARPAAQPAGSRSTPVHGSARAASPTAGPCPACPPSGGPDRSAAPLPTPLRPAARRRAHKPLKASSTSASTRHGSGSVRDQQRPQRFGRAGVLPDRQGVQRVADPQVGQRAAQPGHLGVGECGRRR